MYKNNVIYSVIVFTLYSVIESLDIPQLQRTQTESEIDVKYLLFTRRNAEDNHLLIKGDNQSISDSRFDGHKQTKVIVHGFLADPSDDEWMSQMKDLFLNASDVNVIIVDWSGGNGANGNVDYGRASSNTRVVGKDITQLFLWLQSITDIDLSSVHIVGHSLGAHVAGFVGQDLLGALGHITGLDPAGPNFDGKAPADRLDRTDALFVDVIHTDGEPLLPNLGLGTTEMCGHLDFYPNGGKNQQGCAQVKLVANVLNLELSDLIVSIPPCDHSLAIDYYMESINANDIETIGYEANDYEAFLRGVTTDCGADGHKCAIFGVNAIYSLGFNATTIANKYYFRTASKYPFLTPEFGIKIKISPSQPGDVKGQIIVTVRGTEDSQNINLSEGEETFSSGNTYTYIRNSDHPLGDIMSVSFKWLKRNRLFFSLKPLYMHVESIQVIPMSSKYVFEKM